MLRCWLLLFVFLPLFASPLSAYPADITGTLPAKPILRVTTFGDLIVRGTNATEIHYSGRSSPRLEGLRITFDQPGRVRLEVPKGMRLLELISMAGMVDAADLDGAVRASVAAGRVIVDRIAGDVEIHSSGGPAFIGSVGGTVRCYSAGGAIHASSVHGQGVFETGGGDIQLGQVVGAIRAITAGGAIQIRQAGSEVYADTLGGPIEILRALGTVFAKSSAGPIEVSAAPSVQCRSGSGTIRLNNISGRLLASTMHGSIVAEVLSARPLEDSSLSTAFGDISVLIPSNVGVTVQAQYEGPGNLNAIVSDFPGLQINIRSGGVIARGKINGGGPLLRLSGAGGRIEIKKK